jgi:hypothetical protein
MPLEAKAGFKIAAVGYSGIHRRSSLQQGFRKNIITLLIRNKVDFLLA